MNELLALAPFYITSFSPDLSNIFSAPSCTVEMSCFRRYTSSLPHPSLPSSRETGNCPASASYSFPSTWVEKFVSTACCSSTLHPAAVWRDQHPMYRGGEEEILLVASCYRNRDKLRPGNPFLESPVNLPGPKLILGNLYLEAEMVYSPETS